MSTQLTKNFNTNEITNWAKYQNMSVELTKKLAGFIDDLMSNTQQRINVLSEAKKIAIYMQDVRDKVNEAFPEYEGEIGIRSVCWLRPVAWEIYKGRSGKGQHPTGNASDIKVVNIPAHKYQEVMDWIWDYLNGKNGGKVWHGGLARLHRNGRTSFIHMDLGRKRRWKY